MPSILNDDDKDTVKRFVPKQSNKIQAVAVARLFVAYPDRAKWSYTGLQGAIVLANDLVGNTYWLKMVDISPAGRGVIWDQEIYDSWSYNQDRTFFHTFELEDCLAGLSFVDEKEAKQFKKKMDDREKNASRATKSTPFGGGSQPVHKTSLLGGLFGYRHSSAPSASDMSRASLPPPPPMPPPPPSSEFALLDSFDPLWREHFGNDLTKEGLTDDFIKDNQDFIIDFLRNAQAKSATPPAAANGNESKALRAPPPPPPPPPATSATGSAPAKTASSAASTRRGAPPPPPAPRRSGKADLSPARDASPAREASPPPRPRFSAPPPIADAGKYALQHQEKSRPVTVLNPGPPPPPRPAKTPLEVDGPSPKFPAPPPFTGQRIPFPAPAGRGLVPPPPPPRGNNSSPQSSPAPPPLPPKISAAANGPPPLPPSSSRPVPPPPGPNAPPPPPSPSSSSTPAAPPPPPPPPPPPVPPTFPPQAVPPPATAASTAAPPPAPPPPPPLPPGPDRGSGGSSMPAAPVLPTSNNGRAAMLGDIQKAGGIGSLKKVDRSQIRDRSAAQVGGSNDSGPHATGSASAAAATAGGAGGGMADALAAALQKRKEKVSKSDDEDDDDDW